MRLKDIQHIFHQELDAIYGADEVDSFFYLLTDEFLGMKRLALSLQPNFIITKVEEQPLFEALSKLKLEQPIQYILGKTEFFGLPFQVNLNTLIPRPETEELVDFIIQSHKSESRFKVQRTTEKISKSERLKILDIGTGSGCIAISLAKNMKNAEVIAVDISSEALKVAKLNAELNAATVTFVEADILNHNHWNLISKDRGKNFEFDIIVSNPPYVRNLEKAEMMNNVLQNEPSLALFVDDDDALVFYKAIAKFATQHLKIGGKLYFEINQYLGEEMISLMKSFNFVDIELRKDMSGNDRIICGTRL